MRKILPLVLAAAVGLGTTLTLVAPAEAATAVSIKQVADRFAAPGKTATIKPVYTKAKNVKVVSARLTVKLGKKTTATSKSSVPLKAGVDPKTYSVTTVVKYKVKKDGKYGATKTAKKTSGTTIFACATQSALDAITYSDLPGIGQLRSSVEQKLGAAQGGGGTTLGQAYEDAVEAEDEASQTEINALYEKGWTPSDSFVGGGYIVCGKKTTEPGGFAGIGYLQKVDTEARAYQFLG